jgi:hypothetical protein
MLELANELISKVVERQPLLGNRENLTRLSEEAEAATEEIFTDIWRYCQSARNTQSVEKRLIALIALRWFMKSSRRAKQTSRSVIDVINE